MQAIVEDIRVHLKMNLFDKLKSGRRIFAVTLTL